jgi:hypothetical protein
MPGSKTTEYVDFLQDSELRCHHMCMYRAEIGCVIVCVVLS